MLENARGREQMEKVYEKTINIQDVKKTLNVKLEFDVYARYYAGTLQ
jgi:hypothetical protein